MIFFFSPPKIRDCSWNLNNNIVFFLPTRKPCFFMQTHASAEVQKRYLHQIFTFSLTSHNITQNLWNYMVHSNFYVLLATISFEHTMLLVPSRRLLPACLRSWNRGNVFAGMLAVKTGMAFDAGGSYWQVCCRRVSGVWESVLHCFCP